MAELIHSGRFEVKSYTYEGGIGFTSDSFMVNDKDLDGRDVDLSPIDGVGAWSATFNGKADCYYPSSRQPWYVDRDGNQKLYGKKLKTPASSGAIVDVEIFKHTEFDYITSTSTSDPEFNGFCYYASPKRLFAGTTLMGKPRPDFKVGDVARVTMISGASYDFIVSSAVEKSDRFENGLELEFENYAPWKNHTYEPFSIENLNISRGDSIFVGDIPMSNAYVGQLPVTKMYMGDKEVYSK
ncbi:MAG: hypothetical protein L7S57_00310 [Luminiphilus sp.]|nr:hypothetical protein [Luminiphilus sp.]